MDRGSVTIQSPDDGATIVIPTTSPIMSTVTVVVASTIPKLVLFQIDNGEWQAPASITQNGSNPNLYDVAINLTADDGPGSGISFVLTVYAWDDKGKGSTDQRTYTQQ